MSSRRDLLQIGAALSLSTAGAQVQHHDEVEAAPAKKTAKFFRPEELQLLAVLVEHIIPASDTPGAAAANVHYYIDWLAHTNAVFGERLRKDLRWVAKQKFAAAGASGQVELLNAWNKSSGRAKEVFDRLKSLTIDGYYGTREGLQVELGWNANTFLREYKGCTHPEHA